ncbi:MAG: hypothetical protein IPI55_02655 [Flavobacteriales bacterium]|nr:hypothetical protein [Flavobacteriales bacterium]
MKRIHFLPAVFALAGISNAQVVLDKPLVLSGTDPSDRRIDGLAPASELDNLVTVGAAQDGSLVTALAGGAANAVTLTLQPATLQYSNGLRVRWTPLAQNTGPVTVQVDGLAAVPLRDPSGLEVGLGALRAGVPVEAQFADSVFIFLGSAPSGCPEGFVQVNGQFCMMQAEGPVVNWFDAAAYCSERGASLCTWDEYLFTCQTAQGQLTDLFDNWEWIDDTSDHTHSADQIGRWSCKSMFNISASLTDLGATRCCYRLR